MALLKIRQSPAFQKAEQATRIILGKLVESGLIEAHGSGTARTYTLSAKLYQKTGQKAGYVRQAGFDPIQLPKSKFREALGYFCGLIPYLINYTKHPFARMDNNVAERAIRPLTIGRKNWLFFGSEDGGEAGAILLSFVQTCRGLEINPREYLEDIFRRLMGPSAKKLEELLPDRWLLARNTQKKSQVILTRRPV